MPRRILTQKRFPSNDFQYDSLLVNLLITRLLLKGKKKISSQNCDKSFRACSIKNNAKSSTYF
jgi:ribosomal protein S7